MVGRIVGTGSYAPEKVMDNHDLARIVDTNDEWIQDRTGIVRRHIATEDTTVTMAVKSAKAALENANMNPEEIDAILVSTVSPNTLCPSIACQVQSEIGAVNAFAMDLNAACTGVLFAFYMVQNMIMAGTFKTALRIGSESLSHLVDWTDRGTCILFGDGAGACIVQAQEEGVYASCLGSDGTKGAALTCEGRHRKDFENAIKEGQTFIQMDGKQVFSFEVRQVPKCIQELLAKINKEADDIDVFLLHQANQRILEKIAKRLKVSIDKIPSNIADYGNTSSASIPILLDELWREGRIHSGQHCILAGFGAGLSWGAAYVQL